MCSIASPGPLPSAVRWIPALRWWRNGGEAAGQSFPVLAVTLNILRDDKMSEAHLKMLVEKILVHEEDGKLDLEIRLKAPFRDHLDIFENGERTDSILSAEFDYDRLGAIIYGDYYAG